jgi:archaellum component FlaC
MSFRRRALNMSQQPQVDQESQNGHSETFATQLSVDVLSQRMQNLESNVENLPTRFNEVLVSVVSPILGELKAINGRIDSITGEIKGVNGRIDGVISKIEAVDDRIDGKIDSVTGEIKGVNGRIDSVTGEIKGVNGRIDGVISKIEAVDDRIDGRIDGLRGDIKAIDAKYDGIKLAITVALSVAGIIVAVLIGVGAFKLFK